MFDSEAMPKEVEVHTTKAGTWDATTAESGTRGGLGPTAARIRPRGRVISMVEKRTLPGAN